MIPAELKRARKYLEMSEGYAVAARQLLEAGAHDFYRLPLFMLIAHALELSLKAVLSAAGMDEERLMGIGHELHRCFRLVQQTGLYPSKGPYDLANLVDALATPHALQAFRYPQPFRWDLPEPLEASGALHRHLNIVARAIKRGRGFSA
jgi:HEPN domain-containing protein